MDKAERLRTRDHILELLLFYIANNPEINKEIILRGGNALHFIYASPRHSSDLDFVAPDFKGKIIKIDKELSKTSKIDKKRLIIICSTLRRDLLRKKYAYEIGEGVPFGRVEVLDDKVFGHKQTKGKFSPLLVATPSEIYADKIYATLNRFKERGSFKGTDLFDLEYIVESLKGEASEEEIERKAKHYNFIGYDKQTVESILMRIIDPKLHDTYRRGIRRTMMPDFYNEQEFDKEYFKRCARHFERLRNI